MGRVADRPHVVAGLSRSARPSTLDVESKRLTSSPRLHTARGKPVDIWRSPWSGRDCGRAQRSPAMQPVDPLEVLEVGELDRHLAPLGAHLHPDPGVEEIGRAAAPARASPGGRRRVAPVSPAPSIGAGRRSRRRRRGAGSPPPRTASSTTRTDHPSAAACRASCSCSARSGVPSRARAWPADSRAVGQQVLDGGRKPEQAQRVGDRRTALADPAGDLVVGQLEVLDQLLERGRLLERGQIVAVEVLDQRLLDRADVVGLVRTIGRDASPVPPAARRASAARRRSAR